MKPFLKWAGNKYRLVDRIRELLPSGTRLIEPFVGAGAVSLNTDYPETIANDANADLINLFVLLKAHGALFVEACHELFIGANNTADAYYRLRDEFNTTHDPWRRAVLLVYLNRHGYNGLFRRSSRGYNVPFGRYKTPYFPHDAMMGFSSRAQSIAFTSADFEVVMRQARPGDVVYCDPPYVPLSTTANFTHYGGDGFGLDEQQCLARVARDLAQQGIPVLISNHDNAVTRGLYEGAEISTVDVQRSISRDGQNRTKAPELLALFR